jgi:hypothetical protein
MSDTGRNAAWIKGRPLSEGGVTMQSWSRKSLVLASMLGGLALIAGPAAG